MLYEGDRKMKSDRYPFEAYPGTVIGQRRCRRACVAQDIRPNRSLAERLPAALHKAVIKGVRSGKPTELMNITGGYHYHTVRADSEEILDWIAHILKERKYLAPEI